MKNYLVIGSGSGIGQSIAQQLSEEHTVYGTYYKTAVNNIGGNIKSFYLDVLAPSFDLDFLPDSLDGLVYCPGSINLKSFSRIKPQEFTEDYQLQVIGAIKIIQHCLPRLKNNGAASIVLFSTVAVQTGFTFHSMVSASKGAIEGLTRALAAELAPGIRVNCIAPSITQTPLAAYLLNTPEKLAANAHRHPLKRVGTPEDIASAAVFLLSNQSSWITGQVLHVDGGMSDLRI